MLHLDSAKNYGLDYTMSVDHFAFMYTKPTFVQTSEYHFNWNGIHSILLIWNKFLVPMSTIVYRFCSKNV